MTASCSKMAAKAAQEQKILVMFSKLDPLLYPAAAKLVNPELLSRLNRTNTKWITLTFNEARHLLDVLLLMRERSDFSAKALRSIASASDHLEGAFPAEVRAEVFGKDVSVGKAEDDIRQFAARVYLHIYRGVPSVMRNLRMVPIADLAKSTHNTIPCTLRELTLEQEAFKARMKALGVPLLDGDLTFVSLKVVASGDGALSEQNDAASVETPELAQPENV